MPETQLWTSEDILMATGADLLWGNRDIPFPDIGTDSRKRKPDALFVALQGENHDGHNFMKKALDAGYGGILMEKSRWQEFSPILKNQNLPVFGVDNTLQALGRLARYRLGIYGAKVLAVTGSNGKTSTKEMLGNIFRKQGPCLVTRGNFNNEIGLPLTLFQLKPMDLWAILELGMNHPGEMERLSAICLPDMAVITRIAPAHLEGLGSVEGIAKAKGEIFTHMKTGGSILINGSDPHSQLIPLRQDRRVQYFGQSDHCDFYMKNLACHAGGSSFDLCRQNKPPVAITLNIPGTMMAENALAAAAAALMAGVPENLIQEGLSEFTGCPGRFRPMTTEVGFTVIDDTYNANPDSMEAALKQTRLMDKKGRTFAILGSMGELGEEAPALHRHVGSLAAKAGISALYACGPNGTDIAYGARSAGLEEVFCENKETIASMILPGLMPGDQVLVKGSRSMSMESVVDQLMQAARTAPRK
ncbi:UDP-N-acetylmuramoyl-tripeptide--D-alanyl-D-alanine ligase [Desulfobotulus sp. H1]|uniref:UDP-N-acetylmuramoyl-tripeptide--D-alanyl-D-alanine ligase n=1 Tax=Desulfobotulus pelophilus TaxID=2823377 RepID=A0ABT3N520_9BACT|nr:UDP-N-acetylmuramoyl-tripeptide--D-alanyl-D-alanine ligase [Desulfobotulus pelophilus]MCW7752558.1 UDP-N-acetylmuramoyl-tripeptide--D-alanyl-D-alanine ligase [Desulfobotulus pelophilus]